MTGWLRATVAGTALIFVSGCALFGDSTLGTLVTFEQLTGFDHPIQAAELGTGQEPEEVFSELQTEDLKALPPLADETRRFAFIDAGCKHDSAQLVVEDGFLTAQLLEDGSTEQHTYCEAPVYFLSVFDVPAQDIPEQVRLP